MRVKILYVTLAAAVLVLTDSIVLADEADSFYASLKNTIKQLQNECQRN